MAYIFTDGFDAYSATADLTTSKKWQSATGGWTWGSTSGVAGGGGLSCSGAVQSLLKTRAIFGVTTGLGSPDWVVGEQNTYHTLACWIKFSGLPSALNTWLFISESNSFNRTAMGVGTTGVLCVLSSGGTNGGSGTVNVCDGNWHFIELLVYWGNGAAQTTWYVDYNLDASFTHGTFSNTAFFTGYTFNSGQNSCNITGLDDVMIYDGNNPAPNFNSNFPVGPRRIQTLYPNADSAVQFTRSTGANNFALVDETNIDDTDYVEDYVIGNQDLYDFTNLAYTPATISAVALSARTTNPAAGSVHAKLICKSGATQEDGTSFVSPWQTPALYDLRYEVIENDPNTAAAWTPTNLNAAKFGIKVV